MPALGDIARSDYVTSAAKSYRLLEQDEIPTGHPVALFNRVYREIAGDDGVIERSAFDPADHPTLLQWVQLFERTPDQRFKARLIGTGVARLLKGDFTGWYLDDYITGEMFEHRLTEFNGAIEQRKPYFSMSTIRPENGRDWDVYRGIFPARKDAKNLVFVILAPDSERLVEP